MINKLRRRFPVIAMLSVTLVVLLTAVAINTFNYLSTDSSVSETLRMICENQGMIPQFPGGKHSKPLGAIFPQRHPSLPATSCCTTTRRGGLSGPA